jgi:hypothetical protein
MTMPESRYIIVKAVQTCWACPSQWDAWTDEGQYLYLRFRHGVGTVEEQPSPDLSSWADDLPVIEFTHEELDGSISLKEFAVRAHLALTLEVDRG